MPRIFSNEPDDEAGRHRGSTYMRFEDPPVWTSEHDGVITTRHVMWTASSTKHGTRVNPDMPGDPVMEIPIFYEWIDPVMLHEFGHPLGLHDFYKDPDPKVRELYSIMSGKADEVTPEDLFQLRAIYLRHMKHVNQDD